MMLNTVRKLFTKPSASELAVRELDEARRQLLESQRYRDYYSKMCEFHELRIRSLVTSLPQRGLNWSEVGED